MKLSLPTIAQVDRTTINTCMANIHALLQGRLDSDNIYVRADSEPINFPKRAISDSVDSTRFASGYKMIGTADTDDSTQVMGNLIGTSQLDYSEYQLANLLYSNKLFLIRTFNFTHLINNTTQGVNIGDSTTVITENLNNPTSQEGNVAKTLEARNTDIAYSEIGSTLVATRSTKLYSQTSTLALPLNEIPVKIGDLEGITGIDTSKFTSKPNKYLHEYSCIYKTNITTTGVEPRPVITVSFVPGKLTIKSDILVNNVNEEDYFNYDITVDLLTIWRP